VGGGQVGLGEFVVGGGEADLTPAFSRSISASGTRATPPSGKNLELSSGGNMICHKMHLMASIRATGGKHERHHRSTMGIT